MWSIFEMPAGRVCKQLGCDRNGQQIDQLHERICGSCGQELSLVMQADRRAIGMAIGGGAILLLSLGFGVRAWHHHRMAEREAELLARGKERFDLALDSASAAQVPAILDDLQAELELTPAQRESLLAEAEPRIARLPRDLDASLRTRLERLVRQSLEDGPFSAEERKRIEDFIVGERLDRSAAATYVAEQERRIEEANRSLSFGRMLITSDPGEAREHFKRATEIDPGSGMAWANLGAAEMVLGREARARDSYRHAIEVDPGNWLAHFNLGLAAARSGDPDGALQHLEKALAALPPQAGRERQALLDDLGANPAFAELRKDRRFGAMVANVRSLAAFAR